jgi:hypothetical protein
MDFSRFSGRELESLSWEEHNFLCNLEAMCKNELGAWALRHVLYFSLAEGIGIERLAVRVLYDYFGKSRYDIFFELHREIVVFAVRNHFRRGLFVSIEEISDLSARLGLDLTDNSIDYSNHELRFLLEELGDEVKDCGES